MSNFKITGLPLALAAFLANPTIVSANPIERACNTSERNVSRSLCSCIGDVADDLLTRSQIREGARWFDDPQRAQDTRQSDRESDRVTWQAWQNFSTAAQQRCG